MYAQRKNGQKYTLLPIQPPQPSSFYHYHYPEDPPQGQVVIEKADTLTATRY